VKAVDSYTKAAEQGHPKAMYLLGVCYGRKGIPVKDLDKAMQYYKMAAEKGNAQAQYYLASVMNKGFALRKTK